MDATISKAMSRKNEKATRWVMVQGRVPEDLHRVMKAILCRKGIGWADFVRAAVENAVAADKSRTLSKTAAKFASTEPAT